MPDNDLFDPTDADEKAFREACRSQWIQDVAGAVADLPFEGQKLAFHTKGGVFPSKFRYTKFRENEGGAQNHFQGCARLSAGPYLALSGGDWHEQSSHMFVAKLTSRGRKAKWGTNLENGKPPESDAAVLRWDLDELMWHAGGIASCGDLLAVPIECGGKAPGAKPKKKCDSERSRIVLFDMRRPDKPLRLRNQIDRQGRMATAVGLVHVPNQGYVAAVLSAAKKDDEHQDKRIDFYRTAEDRIGSQFVLADDMVYRVPKALKFDNYQTINFVYQPHGDLGDLYLVAMTGKIADLFWVPFPGMGEHPPARPSLEFLARKEFKLDRNFAEFKAGVGVYAAGGTIRLYAVPQWRLGDGRLQMTEWAP